MPFTWNKSWLKSSNVAGWALEGWKSFAMANSSDRLNSNLSCPPTRMKVAFAWVFLLDQTIKVTSDLLHHSSTRLDNHHMQTEKLHLLCKGDKASLEWFSLNPPLWLKCDHDSTRTNIRRIYSIYIAGHKIDFWAESLKSKTSKDHLLQFRLPWISDLGDGQKEILRLEFMTC